MNSARLLTRLGLCTLAASMLAGHAQARQTGAVSATTLITPSAPTSAQPEDPELRIYDLSELRLSLPAQKTAALAPARSPFKSPPTQTTTRASQILKSMCEIIGIDAMSLTEDIIAVIALPSEHEQFNQLVTQMVEPYATRYTVELVALSVPADESVRIGQLITTIPSDARRLILMTRSRIGTAFEATETTAYISKWQPVVSTNSVGYESKIEVIDIGLVGSLTVTPDENQGVSVRVDGSLSDGVVLVREMPLQSHGSFEIGLPRVMTRSINIDLSMELDALTAVNIVDGFETDTSIVIAIRVAQTK